MATAKLIRYESVGLTEPLPGVTVSLMVGEETGATQISSGVVSYGPGTSIATHHHNAEETMIVIEGEGLLVLQGEEHHLKPYDAVFITPGANHRLVNDGDRPFKIVWTYATVHVATTFVD